MTSVLAAFAIDRAREATVGLLEKSIALVDAARRQGLHVDAFFPDGRQLYCYTGGEAFSAERRGPLAAYFRYDGFWRKLTAVLASRRYDAVWLRAHPTSQAQLRFLHVAKQRGAKVILDLPTYPTTAERSSWLGRGIRLASPALPPRLIDRVVTLSPDSEIFGRPTLHVRNGVRVEGVPLEPGRATGPLRLFGVGQWAFWHGIDRLLRGLATARWPEGFELVLAGRGPASRELRREARRLHVPVRWLGPVYGAVREGWLAWADVGVGCLAIHRKGVYPDQALKHRQYAAAGLPFIATDADPTWTDATGVLRLASDDAPVGSAILHAFAEQARASRSSWGTSLHRSAGDLSWDRTYAELWAYLRALAPAV